jgi:two-component system, cell cycle sensor histidine kinase and response regulator CckA
MRMANVNHARFAEPAAVAPGDVERELRATLAMHRATLEATSEGIVVTDAAGRITAMNQRFIDMWNVPPEIRQSPDFRVWVAWGVTQSRDPGADTANFRAATRSTAAHTAVITLKDGRVFERHSRPQVIDGRIVGRVWCYRDLTDWVNAEDERRQLESQMQHGQKLESLGVLAGGIAHDFNNLLVGILGHAGMALMETPPDSPLYHRIDEIQTAAQRAAELVNQMLAYSGKGRFVVRQCDLSEIAAEMCTLLRSAIGSVEMELRLRPDVPQVEGDPAQMRQVIMNLITNASDAMDSGNGRIILTTGSIRADAAYLANARIGRDAAPGEFVFVEVRDDGCGMDDATVERIFEPFFTTKFTGRGLGLAAVLGIVRRHQGAIQIETAPGQGTTFRVLLPASAAAASPAPKAPSAPAVTRGCRVLVVDDEAPVLRVASEMLKRAGFAVETASGGEQAVTMATGPEGAFDVVLLDMTMPKMNGAETFKRLRSLHPRLAVVLMSGYTGEEAVARFGQEGLTGFVQKPFMPAELVKTIADAVAKRDATV